MVLFPNYEVHIFLIVLIEYDLISSFYLFLMCLSKTDNRSLLLMHKSMDSHELKS